MFRQLGLLLLAISAVLPVVFTAPQNNEDSINARNTDVEELYINGRDSDLPTFFRCPYQYQTTRCQNSPYNYHCATNGLLLHDEISGLCTLCRCVHPRPRAPGVVEQPVTRDAERQPFLRCQNQFKTFSCEKFPYSYHCAGNGALLHSMETGECDKCQCVFAKLAAPDVRNEESSPTLPGAPTPPLKPVPTPSPPHYPIPPPHGPIPSSLLHGTITSNSPHHPLPLTSANASTTYTVPEKRGDIGSSDEA